MELSDAQAVEQARNGDGDAFRVLVDRYGRYLFRVAYRMTGNEQDAEDVVQESFLRAFRNLGSYDGRAAFASWLFRIAHNYSLDLLRVRKARPAASLSDQEEGVRPLAEAVADGRPNPERLAASAGLQQRLREALAGLTEQERTAFTLRHYEELPIAEICEVLETSENAVKHAIFRAVRKVRKAMAEVEGEWAWKA